ncbi:UDP-N-acetylglucosamine--undecaprenyl-phosphate N-acetylglucosaminephosphotransferase [Vibrio sp. 10N.222.51.C12]|uniref:UDP-N-acetylglucosamine--undecaprenyl-phosphate N-acetylglucosaminephosphotransferase n=1 Tax=Vibrio sp. 10N.222.51.C12 TaxID=3229622 RepID=UPI00354E8F4A
MAWQMIGIFVSTFFVLIATHRIAPIVGLVDNPCNRKRHSGQIPLIGGLSIGLVLCLALLLFPEFIPHQPLLMFAILVLLVTGVLDDRFDLSCRSRLCIQAGLALLVGFFTDVKLITFGDAFGLGVVQFEWLAIPMTMIAVIGAINAFNMVDGIDGLLGTLALITFSGLAVLFYLQGNTAHTLLCFMFIAALLPYLAFNLGVFGRNYRLFMGDAGSMVIGFVAIWLLFTLTQTSNPLVTSTLSPSNATYYNEALASISPVTALWLIAVPLMDMVAIMARRIRKGQSPMSPDRGHLHHIFQRIGFSSRQTLCLIALIATSCVLIGVIGETAGVAESVMFYLFLFVFSIYYWVLTKAFRITAYIRVMRKKNRMLNYTIQ